MRRGPPLPVPAAPPDTVPIATGVDLFEGEDGGVVFIWAMATWCWRPGDVASRRLAAVQLVETASASRRAVAAGFGVGEVTLWRWQRDYAARGVAGLEPGAKGPRRASKLTEAKVAEIRAARAEGASMASIAEAVGVSLNSVSRALKAVASPCAADDQAALSPPGGDDEDQDGTELVPLARPEPRTEERQAARAGALSEAPPIICQGSSLPLAGALTILPCLAVTGLLDVAAGVYRSGRSAFYGLRSLVLAVVFAALVGEPRAEGLTRIDPVDLGRLLGLDRAPEVRTLRRRMAALAEREAAPALLEALARRHVESHPEAVGLFYVDGHVRAYHGDADVAKAHVARMRLSMPAATDTWICDARGDGVLVWGEEPGSSLVGELRRVAGEVRALVGPEARPCITFDRGGWSPRLFAELVDLGFDIATYRKGLKPVEAARSFSEHHHTDEAGRVHDYLLADRNVRIPYDATRRYFACRQITRLQDGHQTQVLTTRTDADPAPLAHAMFSRWRQENFFRYMRAHFALDGLDSYAKVLDDPERTVPNPDKKRAATRAKEARAALAEIEADLSQAELTALAGARADALAFVQGLGAEARATPARVPLGERHPDAVRLDPERKRIHDAIRMATYNAESSLARLLGPHYARADDEARTFLREVFASPADLEIVGNRLHVRINALSAPRRSRALSGLCADLTATETTYPGTDLTLVYSVKGF